MNLLGAKLYDPTTAAGLGTAASAMAAFDTTNARITFVVPPSGMVRVVIQCVIHGATTFSQILLGVMESATVKGKVAPVGSMNGTALATTLMTQTADFVVTGLVAGATLVWDAAWGIETFVASSLIKYGGPANATANNDFGALVFQIWDPCPIYTPTSATAPTTTVQDKLVTEKTAVDAIKTKTDFLPSATAGAAGGLQIAGSNAATTYATLTVTGATTLTGNMVLSDGLTISAPSTGNRAGLDIAGNGTGAALKLVAGATGVGFSIAGGGTSGDGIKVTTTSGHGVNLAPVGTSMHGLLSTGGNGGTSDGIKAAAGTGGVDVRAAITGNVTGNLSGSVGSVTGLTASNLDTTISSRMASYTQPTGFLAATFPTSVASPTNITAGTITTATNLTNNNDKTGYSLTQTFPTNFSTLAITVGGAVTVGTVSDKTGYSLVAGYDLAKTAAQAGDAMALTAGERTSLAGVIHTTAIVESYRANGAVPTPAQFMSEVLAHLGEVAIVGTTKTVNKLDHSTSAATFTLDSATAPTSITRAT